MTESMDLKKQLGTEEDFLVFEDDGDIKTESISQKWKVLVADDDEGVHEITKLILKGFVFEGKSIEILDAFSAENAKNVLWENPDVSLILLDVVMEEEDSGLKFVKYIREELKNELVRIILRTGQPGQAPERKVIVDYDINDYKLKTELTSQKLFTTVYTALRAYRDMQKLKELYHEIKESRDRIAKWNEILEVTVAKRTSSITNLLNNAGQGFLSFGKELRIHEEYSLECERIFSGKIAGKKFSDLIFADGEEKKYLELMLIKILEEKNEQKKEIFLPLLPSEVVINNKFIYLNYKVISNLANGAMLMTVLTDITDKKLLENNMEIERKTLKMVVSAVTNYNDFIKLIRNYENFCKEEIHKLLDSGYSLQTISAEIFRNIHTFKGSFGQMDMMRIFEKLHDFETKLYEYNINLGKILKEDFKAFILGFDMLSWLENEMVILTEILGEEYFNHEKGIIVDQIKLLRIEEKLSGLLTSAQLELVMPEIKRLRHRPFKELLKSYPTFVAKLSERLEKPMAVVEITGEDIYCNTEKFHDFSTSLVHVFRNLMDHGIESREERDLNGKEELGRITCQIHSSKNYICLVISDDGSGIDIDEIKEKAVQKGLYTREAVKRLQESEVLNLIFENGFTIKESVSELSGRGVGLRAVKYEVEKLKGSVQVKSKLGEGTEFYFLLPLQD